MDKGSRNSRNNSSVNHHIPHTSATVHPVLLLLKYTATTHEWLPTTDARYTDCTTGWGRCSSLPTKDNRCFRPPDSGPQEPPGLLRNRNRPLFIQGVKRPESKAEHSTSASADDQYSCKYMATSQKYVHRIVLNSAQDQNSYLAQTKHFKYQNKGRKCRGKGVQWGAVHLLLMQTEKLRIYCSQSFTVIARSSFS